uniref:Uncharacterized protein n=1 Tax=Rhizophora mucronata TaxID=61149 RepID=A0A2P2KYZ2_RHIMU
MSGIGLSRFESIFSLLCFSPGTQICVSTAVKVFFSCLPVNLCHNF